MGYRLSEHYCLRLICERRKCCHGVLQIEHPHLSFRVSREIHDGPAQDMANMIIQTSICERLLVIEQGRVVEAGRTEEILQTPKEALTKRLVLASRDIRSYWNAQNG